MVWLVTWFNLSSFILNEDTRKSGLWIEEGGVSIGIDVHEMAFMLKRDILVARVASLTS